MKLNKEQIGKLTNLPETGMGYQIVNIELNNGELLTNLKVYNSEELEYEGISIEDIKEINICN